MFENKKYRKCSTEHHDCDIDTMRSFYGGVIKLFKDTYIAMKIVYTETCETTFVCYNVSEDDSKFLKSERGYKETK